MKKTLLTALLAMLCFSPVWAQNSSFNGDVNGDGIIDVSDVADLVHYLLTGEESAHSREVITVNGVDFTMVKVDGGTFSMGAREDEEGAYSWEKPAHQVTLSSYSICQTEVTQAMWEAVMGETMAQFMERKDMQDCGVGANYPIYGVSWDECQEFITKLNELTGKTFRLPTEAEWEFAARGGVRGLGFKFAGSHTPDEVAWHIGNIPSPTSGTPGYGAQPVATKAANELGLYDMSGNVWEWCQDWFARYSDEAQTNPTGPETGTSRIGRGGGWATDADYCTVWCRNWIGPSFCGIDLGFRIAL